MSAGDAGARGEPAGISRRGFLAAGVGSAALIGLGGFGAASRQAEAAFVRPPGVASNMDLLAACNRCGKCFQACPYEIISGVPLAQSVVGYATPQLVFEHGACDFCMKCVDACPTGALSHEAPAERDCGVAVVVKDACVAWDWSGCTVCHDKCPVEGAITLDDQKRPVVHADVCDGCGLCENVCPSASVRAYNSAVAEKGIVVVSRASKTAIEAFGVSSEGVALAGDVVEEGRTTAVSAGDALMAHSKGIHPAGPDAAWDAESGAFVSKEAQR